MRGFCDIKEVLRISAPELIFLAVLRDPLASCSLSSPFTLELLFKRRRKLSQFNMFTREYSQEERSFLLLFVHTFLCVGHDYVMHVFLVMHWVQISGFRYFSLSESLQTLCCFQNYIVLINFPETFSLRFNSNNHKVDWNIRSFRYFLIFLH